MKVRYVPNILSLFRLLLCIPLFIMTPFSVIYMIIYFIAGTTDVIDGPVARRVKDGVSEFGATLDSLADLILVCVLIFRLIPIMVSQEVLWSWLWLAYVCVVTLKVFASTGVGLIRFKEVISLHTWTFKILVFFLFCFPFFYYFLHHVFNAPSVLYINVFATVLIICGTLVVIEEILIISMTKRPERNIKSILGVKAANLAAEAAGAPSAPSGEQE